MLALTADFIESISDKLFNTFYNILASTLSPLLEIMPFLNMYSRT
uniref:Uncharacterized protein n=1 Tax=virus sp. ct9pU4 TaxID=2828248 RepID=A0A8S5RBK2_9VIRU|nr:MAG TPA: hypothetical protein [virus sp. ct9pU4]